MSAHPKRDEWSPVYVAGPMSGHAEYNFPAFREATARLRLWGFDVLSPHELDEAENDGDPPDPETCEPWDYYLRRDIQLLVKCNAIAVLDGWRQSRGASLEVHIATALGMEVVDAATGEPIRETVLQEADRLVSGDRGEAYGHPLEDFTRTGRLWAPILEAMWTPGEGVPAEAVALCMVGVKMSREANHAKRDNRVDGPGYFKCLDMIHEKKGRAA